LKKAENSDYLIVRVNELTGNDVKGVTVKLPGKIQDAYEVNGQEQKIGQATFTQNTLNFDLSHYTIRSFAVKMAPASQTSIGQSFVSLAYDQDVMSFDDNRTDGDMVRVYDPTDHGNVKNYPAEMIPAELVSEGVTFKMGNTADLQKNVVTCKGQSIRLPEGSFNKVYILAAATEETSGVFSMNGEKMVLPVAKWTGFIGQHYARQFDLDGHTVLSVNQPFLKHDNIAWFASHYHFGYPSRNVPYSYAYLFKYELDIPNNSTEIILPDNDKIKVFAMTVAKNEADHIQSLQPLADDFSENRTFTLRKEKK